MVYDKSYKIAVKASLQVLGEQRKTLCNDCMSKQGDIFMGLYEPLQEERKLYFQMYTVRWLDKHWEMMMELMAKNSLKLSSNEKKELLGFFAGFFSEYMVSIINESVYADLAVRDLLKIKEEHIIALLNLAENCEAHLNELKLDGKKHDTFFKKRIEELKNSRRNTL